MVGGSLIYQVPAKSDLCSLESCVAPWYLLGLPGVKVVSVRHCHFAWAVSKYLEAARAHDAFLWLWVMHASREHRREMDYFEGELGERVQVRWWDRSAFWRELWKRNGEKETWEEPGGIAGGCRTVKLCWGRMGELAERDFTWVRAVADGMCCSLDLDNFEYKLINCKEFPFIFW